MIRRARRIGLSWRPSRSLRWLAVAAAAIALACGLVFMASERWSLSSAEETARAAARGRAMTSQALVTSQLQKFRVLPMVLADYPDVQNALEDRQPSVLAKLDAQLKLIADRTDAAQIYVMDQTGVTVGASNSQLPTSFVGQHYGFRPYFTNAMRDGAAEQFALGTISKRPGLFLARRVATGRGVVAVKVEFNSIESNWSRHSGPIVVRDENGVVIMTSRPDWRLRTTRPLSGAAMAAVVRARLYGERAPAPLAPDLTFGAGDGGLVEDGARRRYAVATLPIPVEGWTITALEPLGPALRAASAEIRIAALVVALFALIAAGLWARAREARQIRRAAQLELEREVVLRTSELRNANEELVRQSRERELNEARLRVAREELAQSNRLATLGQITAGVAHEINQPLTALRTYADSTQMLIDRQRPADAAANITRMIELTERIGKITGELRLFARRRIGEGPVALDDVIDGALLLVGDRLRQHGVAVVRRFAHGTGTMIAADRVRIEQILINLLQNAIDAVARRPAPTIVLGSAIDGGSAVLTVSDNGDGIGEDARGDLFKSFVTSKPDGLGLGLVISRDLAREIGGDLAHVPAGSGATFRLELPLA